jgi:hypothetical protein
MGLSSCLLFFTCANDDAPTVNRIHLPEASQNSATRTTARKDISMTTISCLSLCWWWLWCWWGPQDKE